MGVTTGVYGLGVELHIPYEEAKAKVVAALTDEGFGVLTEIDVQATMREKLDVDFRRYVILGACSPQLAHRALTAETEIGLLLPCNVIVYENERGGTSVSAMNPVAMVSVTGNPDLESVGAEAREKLERVLESMEEDAG
ncbi:MAG: DUF302 domain-containing protein [Gemmatimonadota bacterium]|jgi:uncharacterized protein (DUF302 family)|nr:ABC transporter ATP-binding protein [Gemmatimonadota bacterium]MDP6801968.1 DUF302 domain-containing protein [Gemmatimonadota bacterium]